MRSRLWPALAWGALALTVALTLVALLLGRNLPAAVPANQRGGNGNFAFSLLAIVFSAVGAFLASRRERNRVAWMMCGIGLGISLAGFGKYYPVMAQYSRPGQYPGAKLAILAGDLGWGLAIGTMVSFLPLLFPDGTLLSARWRPLVWLSGTCAALIVLTSWMTELAPSLSRLVSVLSVIPALGIVIIIPAVITSLVLRYRRGGALERLQLKWLLGSMLLVGFSFSVQTFVLDNLHIQLPMGDLITALVLSAIPVSIAIAVLRYRLYEIDVVINRTLVYGALAAFITAVYVGIVVGIGALIGSRGQFSLGLSILATAVVAVAFQPVRTRVQVLANRLVYGYRSTPYEVLTDFSRRVAGTYATEDALPQLARVLAEGTGAAVASVWLSGTAERIAAATWPSSADPLPGDLADRIAEVRHQGATLGELTAKKRPGEPFTPVEEKLLADLAAQAGQVLRNVLLTSELRARLDEISAQAIELRASRQRIVAVQDAERRRLERNIHDGAQQHLVALAVKLRLAATLAKRDPEKARRSLKELEAQTAEARQTLRDLAQGIYPPALRERGLVEALQRHAEVKADGIGRYDPEIEAGVYFSCLEAVQNATKYAKASKVWIDLRQQDGKLIFRVLDDGVGFEPAAVATGTGVQNMKDRVASLGGRLSLESRPGRGTTVSGSLPLAAVGVAS